MRIKDELLRMGNGYTPLFRLFNILPMEDSCMINYLIDLDDFLKPADDFMEVTPNFVMQKFPEWKAGTIRRALASLETKKLIIKGDYNGRGNRYKLNRETIFEMILQNDSEYQTENNIENELKTDGNMVESDANLGEPGYRSLEPDYESLEPGQSSLEPALRSRNQSITYQQHISINNQEREECKHSLSNTDRNISLNSSLKDESDILVEECNNKHFLVEKEDLKNINEFQKKLNINEIEESKDFTVKDNIIKNEKKKIIKPMSKNFKDILETINNWDCPEGVKKELIQYYESKKGRFTVLQVEKAIIDIYNKCNQDWDHVLESIQNSFIKGWFGLYPTNKKTTGYMIPGNSEEIEEEEKYGIERNIEISTKRFY